MIGGGGKATVTFDLPDRAFSIWYVEFRRYFLYFGRFELDVRGHT